MAGLNGDLDRYRLIAPLAPAGGYGVPWSAVDEHGTRYVIKLIQGFLNPTDEAIDRLEMMLARLDHVRSAHVVPIVDAGIGSCAAGRLPWIAMRELPGARSLQHELAQKGQPGTDASRRILRDIAAGLTDLHAVGALHRDLKPGNVLIDQHGSAWLIDFELLKIVDITTRTTRGQEPIGTTVYMAPEQLLGPTLPQSDLWALGLIACELLAGRQPVLEVARAGGRPERVIAAQSLVPPGLPAPWSQLIAALLRKVPTSRPATAERVRDWLDAPNPNLLEPLRSARNRGPRLSVKSLDDLDALELSAARRLPLGLDCVDAAGSARTQVRRVAAAARSLAIDYAVSPVAQNDDQLALRLLDVGEAAPAVRGLAVAAETPSDQVLAPWLPLAPEGAIDLIDDVRIVLRHRNLVGDRQLICTVELDASQIIDVAQRLRLVCGLTALRPDGWRLLVRGLQPGASTQAVHAMHDFAHTLGSCAPCWVHAPGVHRWLLQAIGLAEVLYRPGRELWTRQSDGSPRRTDERVEVDVLAGPVPRDIAERLEQARPDLVACACGFCPKGRLPAPGPKTVAHNLAIFTMQDRDTRATAAADRRGAVLRRLTDARALRGALAEALGWHGEVADLDCLIGLLGSPVGVLAGAVPMLQLA